MTVQALDSSMRGNDPLARFRDPGEGDLDRSVWLTPPEAAKHLIGASAAAVIDHKDRIPHVVTLGGRRYFHIELIRAIRAEQLNGHRLVEAMEIIAKREAASNQ